MVGKLINLVASFIGFVLFVCSLRDFTNMLLIRFLPTIKLIVFTDALNTVVVITGCIYLTLLFRNVKNARLM